eukprot:GEMP01016929.1.p1 GENE.GEMP01016929.1~~GEMP01016929.1.p1  ORF type:complete len:325 (+),score=58.91 GEMP01016929.1:140-1114(+)
MTAIGSSAGRKENFHKGLSAFSFDAIGGHSARTGGVWSMFTKKDPLHGDIVIKPLGTDGKGMSKRGQEEYEFYEKCRDHPLAEFCPKYYGIETRRRGDHELPYLRMEDVTAKYNHANVMDLKIGQQTWDPDATDEKQRTERKKYPPQADIGFRFTGMRIWDAETQDYKRVTREWCLSLQVEDIRDALAAFFPDRLRALLPVLVKRLKALEACLTNHPKWRCYSSSLLIVYEGDPSEKLTEKSIDVRAIDFAHVFPIEDGGLDDGYLFGLATLIKHLEALAPQEGSTLLVKPRESGNSLRESDELSADEKEYKIPDHRQIHIPLS